MKNVLTPLPKQISKYIKIHMTVYTSLTPQRLCNSVFSLISVMLDVVSWQKRIRKM